jgi:hypothetical protein
MRFQILLFILPAVLFAANLSHAQRLIERGMILNPLANPAVELREDESAWFPQVGGWASFGSYGLHGDDNHQWYQHLGGYFEVYRRGSRSGVAFTGQIEFIADANNDINFSPRAIFWEEGLLYTRRFSKFFIQLGYYHRCKHEIDNLRFGEERTTVFGSALGRVVLPVSLFSAGDALLAFQYDHYTITWEKRTPALYEGIQPNWEELVNSFKLNGALKRESIGQANFYADGYVMSTVLKEDFLMNGMIRAEIGKQTGAGEVRFGIHLERLGDSGIPVQPRSVTLLGIGLRIMTPGAVR